MQHATAVFMTASAVDALAASKTEEGSVLERQGKFDAAAESYAGALEAA